MSRVRFPHWPGGMAIVLSLVVLAAGQNSGSAPAGGQQEGTKSAPLTQAPVTATPQQPNAPDSATSPANTGPTGLKPDARAPISSQEQNAQEPSANDPSGMFVFKKQVEEVVLHAPVVDERGRLASYLDKLDFFIFEDGMPQTITAFRRDDVPVAIGIVIDNSGSTRERRSTVKSSSHESDPRQQSTR